MRLIDTMVEDSSFIKMNAPNIEEDTKGYIASLVQFDMQRSLVVVRMDRVHVFALLVADTAVNPNLTRNCLLLSLDEEFQRYMVMTSQACVVKALESQWIGFIRTGPNRIDGFID
jgi:hypothetical protein